VPNSSKIDDLLLPHQDLYLLDLSPEPKFEGSY
jgi:hypothetical protein